jgi:hypothetical protein
MRATNGMRGLSAFAALFFMVHVASAGRGAQLGRAGGDWRERGARNAKKQSFVVILALAVNPDAAVSPDVRLSLERTDSGASPASSPDADHAPAARTDTGSKCFTAIRDRPISRRRGRRPLADSAERLLRDELREPQRTPRRDRLGTAAELHPVVSICMIDP